MGVCCGKYVVEVCYGSMLWEYVVEVCYGSRLWEYVMGVCYGSMLWEYAMLCYGILYVVVWCGILSCIG